MGSLHESRHIFSHINIHILAVKCHRLRRGDADIAAGGIQMDFIDALIGDDDAFIFGEDHPVPASGLDGFHAVVASPTQRGSSMEYADHHKRSVRVVVQNRPLLKSSKSKMKLFIKFQQ